MLSVSTCPMCESSKQRGLARCPCELGDVRRGLVLLCLGWAGDQREFERENRGWRLGNGVVVTPWTNKAGEVPVPDDAWDALDQIEAHYTRSLDTVARNVRLRIDLGDRRG